MNQQEATRQLERGRKPVHPCSFTQLFLRQSGTFPNQQMKKINEQTERLSQKHFPAVFPHAKTTMTRRLIFVKNEQALFSNYFL